MWIGPHEVVGGACLHCGALVAAVIQSETDGSTLSCTGQPPHVTEKPRPEPQLRTLAADDFDVIRARLAEIEKGREPVAEG